MAKVNYYFFGEEQIGLTEGLWFYGIGSFIAIITLMLFIETNGWGLLF